MKQFRSFRSMRSPLRPLAGCPQSNHVAVGIRDRCNQHSAADIPGLRFGFPARRSQLAEFCRDVVSVPIHDWSAALPMWVKTDLQLVGFVSNVERRVGIRLDAQE